MGDHPLTKSIAKAISPRKEGETWEGASGRWFKLAGGHPVPTAKPGGDGGEGTPANLPDTEPDAPSTPSPTTDPSAPDKAASIQSAADAAHVALSNPESLTFDHLAKLVAHLGSLESPALKKMAADVAKKLGGVKSAVAGMLKEYVKGQGASDGGAAGDTPSPSPSPELEATEKEVRAEIEKDKKPNRAGQAARYAEVQPLLDKIRSTHSPAEIKELAKRVTGDSRGRTVDDWLNNIRADMTAVTRLVESQQV